jgi:hypothetical protein
MALCAVTLRGMTIGKAKELSTVFCASPAVYLGVGTSLAMARVGFTKLKERA